MSDAPEIVNLEEFANRVRRSMMTISAMLNAGRIPGKKNASGHWEINFKEGFEAWKKSLAENSRRLGKVPVTHEEYLAKKEKRKSKDEYLARLAQIKVWKEEGKLIEVDRVEQITFDSLRSIREMFMSMADRLAPILAAENDIDACHAIIFKDVNDNLTEAANEIERAREKYRQHRSFVDESDQARAHQDLDPME